MYIPEGVEDTPMKMRASVVPTAEELHVFSFARYIAVSLMRSYMSSIVYTMRPYFVEGYGIRVDKSARLYVGIESLRQFDATREMGRRLGQKILDAAYAILMDLHVRAESMPEVEKASVAAELETTRYHDETITKYVDRGVDSVFTYPERFEEELGTDYINELRKKGAALEELYAKLKSRNNSAELDSDGSEIKNTGTGRGSMSGLLEHDLDADNEEDKVDERPGRSKDEIDAAKETAAASMLAAGNVPGDMLRWAEVRKQPVVVPWYVALRRVSSRIAADKPGTAYESYDDRADEQVAVDMQYAKMRGTSIQRTIGVPRMPATRGYESMIDIYVDTSGSMGREELGTVLSQVDPVFKRHKARIRVWAGDTEVQGTGAIKSLKEMAQHLKGGGGTSFVPAFKHWESMPPNKRPKSVMFFTDGYGPAPAAPPRGIRVYWILVGNMQRVPWVEGSMKDVTYGTIVRVKDVECR